MGDYPRPVSKLRIQANKIKHVLSANNDMPIFIDSLYDDTNYQSHMNRAQFEELCHDLILKTTAPIEMALKAANVTLKDIDAFELIGGGMRIPKIQEQIQHVLGDSLELGMHINSDESMALGAAFHGANVSTAFRVRQVGMTDINPFPIVVSLEEMEVEETTGLFGIGGGKKKQVNDGEEVWSKQATIFKANGKVGVKKTIAFTQEQEINVAIDYEDSEILPKGTARSIERYNVTGIVEFAKEMEDKKLGKPKVSLQFDLSTSGLTKLIKAEAAVEETYMVEEEVEVEDENQDEEEDTAAADEVKEETSEGSEKEEVEKAEESEEEKVDNAEGSEEEKVENTEGSEEEKVDDAEQKVEKNEEDGKKTDETDEKEDNTAESDDKAKVNVTKVEVKKKKMKTITVEKEKTRVHKRVLSVDTYHVGRIQPYSVDTLNESLDKLGGLAASDAERIRFEEVKNKYESYIYRIKNKLIDEVEAIEAVTNEEQRDALLKSSQDAEEWMYDEGYDADLVTYEDKYVELSEPAEKVFFRMAEVVERPKAVEALQEKLVKIIALLTKWETTMPQITADERLNVVTKVDEVKKSMAEKEEAQAAVGLDEDPVYTSAEIPPMTKEIQGILSKLSKRPKPKEEKKEEKDTKSNSTGKEGEAAEDSAEETKDSDGEDEETKDTDEEVKDTESTGEKVDDADDGENADSTEDTDETDTNVEDESSEEKLAEDEL